MSFKVTGNKGFHVSLENGITISVQFGAGNYCEHYDGDIGSEKTKPRWESIDAEIAVWDKDNNWFNFEKNLFEKGSDVIGRQSANDFADMITKFKNWKF